MRWSIELNLYDFEIIYKKGKRHSDADAMSRLDNQGDDSDTEDEEFAGFMMEGEGDLYLLMGMDDFDTTTAVELISIKEKRKILADAQDEDLMISEVKELVRLRKQPLADQLDQFYRQCFNKLVIQKNILYRKTIDAVTSLPILQAIIPRKLVPEILSDAHGGKLSGHPGHQRMVDTLRKHVTWPGMWTDCKKIVAKCHQCDRMLQPNPKPRTELQPINPSFVFEQVCCDLITLPPSRGWNYVCVFMDMFSRHVTCYKMRDKTTLSFTRALEDYITHVGCPQTLSSDNGPEFCSDLVDAISNIIGMKRRTSVVYRPQSQGCVERWNRQLIQELRARLDQTGDKWPDHVNYVAMAHNASPASGTGESPNLVFYGRELPIPTFTDFDTDTLREKSVKEYVKLAKERVRIVHEAVRAESKKRSDKTAEAYNKKAKHTPLSKGDLVYYQEVPKNLTKLDINWAGPVQVDHCHPNAKGGQGTTYTVKFKEGETMRRNYEQLKRVRSDHPGPISKHALPATPAPRIPCVFDDGFSSDEEVPPPPPSEPVAARTRNRVRQARTLPSRPAPAPAPNQGLQPQAPPALLQPLTINTRLSSLATVPAILSPVPLIMDEAVPPPPSSTQLLTPARSHNTDPLMAVGENSVQSDFSSEDGIANLTDVTRISGVQSFFWDTEGEALSNPIALGSDMHVSPPLSPVSAPDRLSQAQLDPNGLPPPAPTFRSPSSLGTTPENSQDTVVHLPGAGQVTLASGSGVSPPPSPNASESQSPNNAIGESSPKQDNSFTAQPPVGSPLPSMGLSPQDVAAPPPTPATTDSQSPSSEVSASGRHSLASNPGEVIVGTSTLTDTDDGENLDDFLQFLDTADEELVLREGVGRKKIQVILHNGYEYRRDRVAERMRKSQNWVCRYASRTRCKGRIKLNVVDLNNFMEGASISDPRVHNHSPYRVNTHGLADVTEVTTDDSGAGGHTSDDDTLSSHAISQLNEGDFLTDFNPDNLGHKSSSSPVRRSHISSEFLNSSNPASAADISWDLMGVSQVDTSAFQAVRHVPRGRTRRITPFKREVDDENDPPAGTSASFYGQN